MGGQRTVNINIYTYMILIEKAKSEIEIIENNCIIYYNLVCGVCGMFDLIFIFNILMTAIDQFDEAEKTVPK